MMTTFHTLCPRQQRLPFTFTLILCLIAQMLCAQATWTGNISTDWNLDANWNPAVVPTGSVDVTIPDVTNDPVISAAAVAKSILINGGGDLTVAASGSLTINGSTARGIFNFGTVTNNGIITIGASADIGQYGIDNRATFHNNAGAEIHIDRASEMGLLNNSIFNNAAKITIGAVASVGGFGIQNWGTFTNSAGAEIRIDRSTYAALWSFGSFTNAAKITIGSVASVGLYGILTQATFHNNAGGEISIDRSTDTGLYNGPSATFTNAAKITIGALAGVGQFGLYNRNIFNNNTGGEIRIDQSTFNALYTESAFTNAAVIIIGATGSVGPRGLFNFAVFNNNAGGEISINRSSGTGLWNYFSSTFTNAAKITIGAVASVGAYGIDNYAVFNNNAGGDIRIDRSTNNGINNEAGTFTNAAKITIGAVAGVTGRAIRNVATFQNSPCAALIRIASNNIIQNTGTFTNTGGIIENATGNSSISSNTGVVQNLNGGTFTIGSGNAAFTTTGDIWTGCTDTDWATASNWLDGTVPSTTDDATILNVTNDPVIMGGTAAVAKSVAVNASGSLTVNATGSLTINGSTTGQGILNQGTVENFGSIAIGTLSSVGDVGVYNKSTFNNNTGGVLTIDRSTFIALFNETGVFTNTAQITIGAVTSVGTYGIRNRAAFNNNTDGNISINRTGYIGLYGESGTIANAAKITIGAGAGVTGLGIYNLGQATFHNTSCATLTMVAPLNNSSTFTNSGLFTVNTATAHTNSALTNNGIIEYPQGNPIPNVTNDDLVVAPISGECTITPALQIGGSNSFTAGSTWYTDQNLTNPAGAYNQATNTFTVNNLAEGTHTLYCSISDNGNGCPRTVSIQVAYDDVTKPTITCPDNLTVAANGGCAGTVGDRTALTTNLTDNCGTPTVSQSPAANTALNGHDDAETVTLTANDGNGNTESCTFTVTLKDVTPPTALCNAAAAQIQANKEATIVVADVDNNSTDNCVVATRALSKTVFTCANIGANTVTLTVTDINGVTATCSATVTITDPNFYCCALPEANCKTATVALVGNTATVVVADVNNNSLAECGLQSINVSPNTFNCSHAGTQQTVTLTITDINGNSDNCQVTVNVVDDTAPTIACPNPVTVSCSANIPAINLAAVTASDNCSTPTKSHVNDVESNQTCANRFTVTRTYRAIDGSNNSATCSQIITVSDNTVPVFSFVPANVTVQCNSLPSVGNVLASDGCGGAVTYQYLGETRTDGNCPDTYTLTRRWTATDVCGNVRTATQVITVRDTQAPLFLSVPANVTVQCNAIPAVGAPTAFDNCDASVGISYTGETRINGACPDSYTLIRRWTAMDNCGNTRTASHRITVVDTQKPTFANVPADITLQCSDPVPGVVNPTASDNCDASVTVQYLGQITSGATCANTYLLLRRWKATDNCGNFTQVTQTITIRDTQAPVFTSVPADMTIQCSAPFPLPGTATATDNCAGFVQVVFQGETRTDGDCLYDYAITRTWRAVDQCGNSVTASQVISVVDTQSPTFQNPPANVTVTCSNIPNPPVVVGQDNCGPATVAYQGQNQSPGDCNSGYTITRTWTATDLCGNSSTYTQTITVQGQGLEEPGGEERRREEIGGEGLPFAVRLMPNPAFDAVQVRYDLEQSAEATIIVTDLSGRVVHTRTYLAEAGENVYALELETLAGGVYLVQVQAADRRAVEKLIVLER